MNSKRKPELCGGLSLSREKPLRSLCNSLEAVLPRGQGNMALCKPFATVSKKKDYKSQRFLGARARSKV